MESGPKSPDTSEPNGSGSALTITHLAIHFMLGGIHRYKSACGIPDVTTEYWTVNKELVTCQGCKSK